MVTPPGSDYPDLENALLKRGNDASCSTVNETVANDTANATQSTVTIIGQRLEQFFSTSGHYPVVNELQDIGLVIKKNNANANQQQLYCRNDTKAIYAQYDSVTNIVFIYDTAVGAVVEDTTGGKLSLNSACPDNGVNPTDPGYESTGIKNPDL